MVLRDHIPGAGAVGSGAAIVGDLILNSGDLLFGLVAFLVTSPESWLSVVLYGRQLASLVPWIPQGPLEILVIVGLVLAVVVSLGRLIDRWRSSS